MNSILNTWWTACITILLFLSLAKPTAEAQREELILRSHRSIFRIVEKGVGGGTAFQISYKGKPYLLSAGHVCEGKTTLGIMDDERNISQILGVLSIDQGHDLCLLTPAASLPLPLWVSGRPPKKGSYIATYGHAFLGPLRFTEGIFQGRGVSYWHADEIVTRKGCEEAKGKWKLSFSDMKIVCVVPYDLYFATLQVNRGSSGSPAFDKQGRVVGVVMGMRESRGLAFIVPGDIVRQFLEEATSQKEE